MSLPFLTPPKPLKALKPSLQSMTPEVAAPTRPAVLIFAGLDPSGGAGLAADICAIQAMGAHALPVITVLTAQDNNRVYGISAVSDEWVRQQADAVSAHIAVAAVKIGIIGSHANALVIADIIRSLRQHNPLLPVVLDPVLASGHGDALAQDDPLHIIAPLLPLASVVVPNHPEALRLSHGAQEAFAQAQFLLHAGCGAVLLKGGHLDGEQVTNHWFEKGSRQSWHWPRLPGSFHGSGCTLAASLAAALALGLPDAAAQAQAYTQAALAGAYRIAPGQLMPNRVTIREQEN
ncbi:MAG: hypothetical protein RL748_1053 [Pseudomonadota bacterium]|jgi:hydroxymethylpyrimidine/phosphomethylpyrimidine kinase